MPDRFDLTIGGNDAIVRVGTLKITESLGGRNTLTCQVLSLDAATRYDVGEEVILDDAEDPGDRKFGGNISIPSEHAIDDQLIPEFAISVSAAAFDAIPERRTVIGGGIPAGYTLKQAVVSLAGYLTSYGVTVDPAQVDGPTLPLMQYDVKRVSAWFDELTVITNYVRQLDYEKVLRFIEIGSQAAPFFIADDDGNTVGDIVVEPSDVDYANLVIVAAGTGQREVTEALTFNGTDDFIDLTYTLVGHRGYLTVNGVNETLGGSPAIWVFDTVVPNRIKREAGAPAAGVGEIIYTAQFPYYAQADDLVAQAGPRGIVDAVIEKTDVFDADLAQALADGYLLRLVNEPRTVRFSTYRPGLHPGQVIAIDSSVRDISLIALITDVSAQDLDGETMRYDVVAVEGDIYPGSWRDMWRTMASGAGGGASSASSGAITVVTSGGVGGSGTAGSLAQWVTASTLGNATAVPASLLTGTIAAARLPQFTGGDVVTSGAGSVALAIQSGVIFNTHVNAAAAIAWTKISKTGSSLADLTTRSASDLTSGNLAYARMPTGSGTWSASPTISGDTIFGGSIGTASYASQTTGWRITSAGEADLRYLFVDEMHAKSFIADLEQALAGGQIIAKSVAMVGKPFTAPALGGSTTLWVRDLPSAPNMAAFESGDFVVLRSFSRAAGALTIGDCVGQVTSYADGSGADAGLQSWTFTRASGSDGGSMSVSGLVEVDSLVIDYGVSGNGYYEVNSIDGIYGANSPYAQVVTWTTAPVAAHKQVRVRMGNVRGLLGSTEYGIMLGTDLINNQFIVATDARFQARGMDFMLFDGANISIRLSPAAPSIALGNPIPTDFTTNAGVWMGKDSSVYKFRVGDPSGHKMTWDGSVLAVTGTLTATSGTIGNFTISSTTLASAAVDLNSAGAIHVGGSAADALWISSIGGAPHRIWIGDNTASANIWYVNANGQMYARDGLILGPTSVTAIGLTFEDSSSHPTAPTAGAAVRVYMKSDKLVVQYNLGGTAQYFWLDLTSGSGTWSFSTSAP